MRYVDDNFVIQQEELKHIFLEHINEVDPAIKFTLDSNKQDGTILFLDAKVKPEADNTLSLTVYRKPMHTYQYLQWESHHNLVAKYSVVSILTHRVRTVCTKPELLNQETQHLTKAQTKCKYPKWAWDKVERRFISNNQEGSNVSNNQGELSEDVNNSPSSNPEERDTTKEKYKNEHIVIPYTPGLRESIKNICKSDGIQAKFKENRAIENILINPKDKDPLDRKSRAIYWYQCKELMHGEEYIGETSRTFGERYKEHLKEPLTHLWTHQHFRT